MKDAYAYEHCIADLFGPGFVSPNGWLITRIHTTPGSRHRGQASKLLKIICAEADREGVTLWLEAEPSNDSRTDPPLTMYQLLAFYRRHGFSSPDINRPEVMRR